MLKYYSEVDKINVIENFVVPDTFFINSEGKLYNGLGKKHEDANLLKLYLMIKKNMHNDFLEKTLAEEEIRFCELVNTGIITQEDIDKYLQVDIHDIHDPLVLTLVRGAISSRIIMLKRFLAIKNNSMYVRQDMHTIINETKDNISDILIRLCGFHKIESGRVRIIETTNMDMNNFWEYLDRDYRILISSKVLVDSDSYLRDFKRLNLFLEKNPEYERRIRLK